ncbi:hypothetical protein ES703_72963 [subsurface metagenome]
MGKKEKSKGGALLMHKRNFSNRPRLTRRGVAQIKDSIRGIVSDMTQGHGKELVPISIHSVRLRLRQDYDLFLTYVQVGNYMRKLVEEGILEKEDHHRDRTAQHWSDQFSRYRFTPPSTDDTNDPSVSVLEPDPGR